MTNLALTKIAVKKDAATSHCPRFVFCIVFECY